MAARSKNRDAHDFQIFEYNVKYNVSLKVQNAT